MSKRIKTDRDKIVPRLRELVKLITSGTLSGGEFSMRVPADANRDADIVMSSAADCITEHDERWQRLTDACTRWDWGHCTTEIELIEQIDFVLATIERVRVEVETLEYSDYIQRMGTNYK